MGCQLAAQLHTALGLDAAASEHWVDVLTDGYAFRLLLATERDAAMQQRALQLSECPACCCVCLPMRLCACRPAPLSGGGELERGCRAQGGRCPPSE